MAKEIIDQLETALNETLQLLGSLSEKELNKVPFEDSWTAAQVCRHLYKSERGIEKLFLAPSTPSDRNPEERAARLKETFLNFETKMKSPDFILPEDRHYTREELEQPLTDAKEKIIAALHKANLNELAPLDSGHPLEGTTKLELIHFLVYHTIRHNHQLRNIITNV